MKKYRKRKPVFIKEDQKAILNEIEENLGFKFKIARESESLHIDGVTCACDQQGFVTYLCLSGVVNYSYLKDIVSLISKLHSLKELDLSENSIFDAKDLLKLATLQKLKCLNVDWNEIMNVHVFEQFPALVELSIEGCSCPYQDLINLDKHIKYVNFSR